MNFVENDDAFGGTYPGDTLDLFEEDVAQRRNAFGAGNQHEVESTGTHGQVLDPGDCGELGAQCAPVVLLDVDEHQSGHAKAESVWIHRCGEAGDDVLVAQALQPGVRG